MKGVFAKGGALWGSSTKHTAYEEPIDPNNPGKWVMVGDNESYRHWELDLGDRIIRKSECKHVWKLLEDNQREMNENAGRRWGDGKSIGSVPMNVYFQSGLAQANQQRDWNFVKRFWNDPDNKKLRKFPGRI
jgi:hypothetical protein